MPVNCACDSMLIQHTNMKSKDFLITVLVDSLNNGNWYKEFPGCF
jgi:hypothetical protein